MFLHGPSSEWDCLFSYFSTKTHIKGTSLKHFIFNEESVTHNSSFITHLDWSEDSKYLQTNSGAAERLMFLRCQVGVPILQNYVKFKDIKQLF